MAIPPFATVSPRPGPQPTSEEPSLRCSRKGPQVWRPLGFRKALQGRRHLLDMTKDKDSWGQPARKEGPLGKGLPRRPPPPESHSSPLFGYKGLTLKAAADSGVSLLARGRVTVRRDTEAPMSPGVAASGDRAAEGLLPRARPLRPRDGPRPRAIGSLRLLLPGAGMHRVSHRLAFRAP